MHNRRGDGGNLRGGLAQAEDDLRESLTRGAVVIHLGEPQIGQRFGAQRRQQRPMGIVGRAAAVADLVKENSQLVWAHHRVYRACFVDFSAFKSTMVV